MLHGALCIVAWDIWFITHQTSRVKPEEKVILVNIKSQTNMHYLLNSPLWLVLAISKHTRYSLTVNKVGQRKDLLLLPVVYETESTTSCLN